MKRTTVIHTLSMIAVAIALTTGMVAQTSIPKEHYTYAVVHPEKADGPTRYDIIINRWSTEAERDRLLSNLSEGVDKLARPLTAAETAGYMQWPGRVEYDLKYASRVLRADGSEDVVLATDRPVFVWWDSEKGAAGTKSEFSVLQLRLNKDGRGEGKLSLTTKIGANKDAKTIMVEDFASQRTLLADVQRGRSNSD